MTQTARPAGAHVDDLARDWCRMWNDDPGRARGVVTGDFRMWFGASANGDSVTGPEGLAGFAAQYRRERGVRFTPRLVVTDGADRVAYTWDAAFPDGSVRTGADVSTLRGGRVADNWSIAGDRPALADGGPSVAGRDGRTPADGGPEAPGPEAPGPEAPGPEAAGPEAAGPEAADRTAIAGLAEAWTAMWNGEYDLAGDIVAGDFRIWFGAAGAARADDARGPDGIAGFVRRHREGRDGLRYALHRVLVIDVARQRAACTWSVTEPRADGGVAELGGIDVFRLRDGRLSRAWSLTGERPFRF